MANTGDTFYKYLKENASATEKGDKYILTSKAYSKFLVEQGITDDIQKKLAEISTETTTGGIKFLSEIELDEAKKLIKDGKKDEAKEIKKNLVIKLPDGQRNMRLEAYRKFPGGPNSDVPVEKFARWDDDWTITKSIDKDVYTQIQEDFKKVFSL